MKTINNTGKTNNYNKYKIKSKTSRTSWRQGSVARNKLLDSFFSMFVAPLQNNKKQ